jgi:hypothetical protein
MVGVATAVIGAPVLAVHPTHLRVCMLLDAALARHNGAFIT